MSREATQQALNALEGKTEPVAEWVKSPYGNIPMLQWADGYVAGVGDRMYLVPQPAPVASMHADSPTQAQKMRDAGYTRRPSIREFPSDADTVPAAQPSDLELVGLYRGVREVLQRHGITKVENFVVEADLIDAVLALKPALQPLDEEMTRKSRLYEDYTYRSIFIEGWLSAERAHKIGNSK